MNNYLIVLDYAASSLLKIKMTDVDKNTLDTTGKYPEIDIYELGMRYGFDPKNSSWMFCDSLDEYEFNF